MRHVLVGLLIFSACGSAPGIEEAAQLEAGIAQDADGNPVNPTEDLPNPQEEARNDACDYHGTLGLLSPTYQAFEADLIGPRGNTRSIREQVNTHEVGGVSIAIIEDGAITQHHWYGCRDRKGLIHTSADTVYQAASLSKAVSAQAVVEAARRGQMNLTKNIYEYGLAYPTATLYDWVLYKFIVPGRIAWTYDITPQRMLNMTAGLDAHGVGTASPGQQPDIEDALMHDGIDPNGVQPLYEPKTVQLYSGGGYVATEHILELETGTAFKTYAKNKVLDVLQMNASTYDLATTSMPNLARGCSRDSCSYDVLSTKLKAAGGLLTTVRDYARFVMILGNMGVDPATGAQVIPRENVEQALTPGAHESSSLASCTTPGAVSGQETCVAGKWRRLLLDDDGDAYGLGVGLEGNIRESDGYHQILRHNGSQTGFETAFKYKRGTKVGIVVMVNGENEFVKDGLIHGSDAFVDEIMSAFERHY